MSDRRSSKPRPLFAGCPTHPEHADRKHDYMGNVSNYGDPCSFQIEPATVEEALAVVRRGVESGTIKGEVDLDQEIWNDEWRVKVWHTNTSDGRWSAGPASVGQLKRILEDYGFLVIPGSDGGSET